MTAPPVQPETTAPDPALRQRFLQGMSQEAQRILTGLIVLAAIAVHSGAKR